MKNYFSYKCRAECYFDIEALITLIIPTLLSFNVVRINESIPDVELTFISSLNMRTIKNIIGNIPDSHVMIDTLNFENLYTGNR